MIPLTLEWMGSLKIDVVFIHVNDLIDHIGNGITIPPDMIDDVDTKINQYGQYLLKLVEDKKQ